MSEKPIGALYSCREQAVVLKSLRRERGDFWARDLSRAEFRAVFREALNERYGKG